jgi:hypothetical protein
MTVGLMMAVTTAGVVAACSSKTSGGAGAGPGLDGGGIEAASDAPIVQADGPSGDALGPAWTITPWQNGGERVGIAYGNSLWVAVGTGVTDTSPDGTHWTEADWSAAAPNYENDSLAFGNGFFVSPSAGPVVSVSSDGKNWVSKSLDGGQSLLAAAYGQSRWVMLDDHFLTEDFVAVWVSTDAATWSPVTTSIPYAQTAAIAFGAGQFALAGYGSLLAFSPDGVTWTQTPAPDSFTSLAYGNGVWVAGSVLDGVYESPDGKTWTHVSEGGTVCFGNGTFAAVSSGIFTSTDGVHWTQHPLDDPDNAGNGLSACAWGAGHFIAVGEASQGYATSP